MANTVRAFLFLTVCSLACSLPHRHRTSARERLKELDDAHTAYTAALQEFVGQPQKNLYEGDIRLTRAQRGVLTGKNEPSRVARAARRLVTRRWPAGVIIYNILDHPRKGVFTDDHKAIIRQGMDYLEENTCVKFKEVDFDTVKKSKGLLIAGGWRGGVCQSNVGFTPSPYHIQTTWLMSGCMRRGRNGNSIGHELMHVLGFWHEQSRPDRDDYVKIFRDRMKKGMESQFLKYSTSIVNTLQSEYDYSSVLHYSGLEYKRNGVLGRVIEPINPLPLGAYLGQRRAPTLMDLFQANTLYDCKDKLGVSDRYHCLGCINKLMVITLTSNGKTSSSAGPVLLQTVLWHGTMFRSIAYKLENSTTGTYAESHVGRWSLDPADYNITCLKPSAVQMASILANNTDPWKPVWAYLLAFAAENTFLLYAKSMSIPFYKYGKEEEVHQVLDAAKPPLCEHCATSCLSFLRLVIITDKPTLPPDSEFRLPVYTETATQQSWRMLSLTRESAGLSVQHTLTVALCSVGESCLPISSIKNIWLKKKFPSSKHPQSQLLKQAILIAQANSRAEFILASWSADYSGPKMPSFIKMKIHGCDTCPQKCNGKS